MNPAEVLAVAALALPFLVAAPIGALLAAGGEVPVRLRDAQALVCVASGLALTVLAAADATIAIGPLQPHVLSIAVGAAALVIAGRTRTVVAGPAAVAATVGLWWTVGVDPHPSPTALALGLAAAVGAASFDRSVAPLSACGVLPAAATLAVVDRWPIAGGPAFPALALVVAFVAVGRRTTALSVVVPVLATATAVTLPALSDPTTAGARWSTSTTAVLLVVLAVADRLRPPTAPCGSARLVPLVGAAVVLASLPSVSAAPAGPAAVVLLVSAVAVAAVGAGQWALAALVPGVVALAPPITELGGRVGIVAVAGVAATVAVQWWDPQELPSRWNARIDRWLAPAWVLGLRPRRPAVPRPVGPATRAVTATTGAWVAVAVAVVVVRPTALPYVTSASRILDRYDEGIAVFVAAGLAALVAATAASARRHDELCWDDGTDAAPGAGPVPERRG